MEVKPCSAGGGMHPIFCSSAWRKRALVWSAEERRNDSMCAFGRSASAESRREATSDSSNGLITAEVRA